MNFVPTTQKASLRTGGYSQFVLSHYLIWKFDFNVLRILNTFTLAFWIVGKNPRQMSKQYNRDSTIVLRRASRGAKLNEFQVAKLISTSTKEINEND